MIMICDNPGNKVSWIKCTIVRRMGPATNHVSICDLPWKRNVDQIHVRERDAMCKLIGSELITPIVFDCIVPMSVPLKRFVEPINNYGDVQDSHDSLSTELSTSDYRKLSVHMKISVQQNPDIHLVNVASHSD